MVYLDFDTDFKVYIVTENWLMKNKKENDNK